MEATFNYKEIITKDLEELTPDLIQEVIDFIEFLKNKKLKRATAQSQHAQLTRNWTR